MSQCGTGCSPQVGYSRLENIASSTCYQPSSGHVAYAISAPIGNSYSSVSFTPSTKLSRESVGYSTTENNQAYQSNQEKYLFFKPQVEYNFTPDNFLKPANGSKFVGKAEEVKDFVEETFERIFNQPFPNDIKISVLDEKQFKKLAPSSEVIGLSINRGKEGLLSEIFVKNDFLGRVMLTIGHELGHVLTPTLNDGQDEEAKAYAFSMLWMKVIKENNIANLGEAIVLESPAQNGLHDVAFEFVQKMIQKGEDLLRVYQLIYKGILNVKCSS